MCACSYVCLHVCLSERVHLNFPSITSYYPGDKSAGLTEPPPIGAAPGSKCPPQHQPVGLHWDIKRKVCVILFIQKSLKRHREVEGDLLWMVRLVKRGLRMRCLTNRLLAPLPLSVLSAKSWYKMLLKVEARDFLHISYCHQVPRKDFPMCRSIRLSY